MQIAWFMPIHTTKHNWSNYFFFLSIHTQFRSKILTTLSYWHIKIFYDFLTAPFGHTWVIAQQRGVAMRKLCENYAKVPGVKPQDSWVKYFRYQGYTKTWWNVQYLQDLIFIILNTNHTQTYIDTYTHLPFPILIRISTHDMETATPTARWPPEGQHVS